MLESKSFDTIPNNMLQDIFAYMNARLTEGNKKNNNNNNNLYPIGNNLVFGEELNTYIPVPGQNHHSVMESDPFYTVRVMASNITREVYGEPRLVDLVVGVYKDLVAARKSRGYHGVRGMNMKGVVTACLYMIILYEEQTRMSIEVLIKAANRVNGQSKTKVTEKMINKYIQIIVNNLKTYQESNSSNSNNNDNNRTVLKYIDQEIKRIMIKLKRSVREVRDVRALARTFPRRVLVDHIPRTVAGLAVFTHVTRDRRPSEAIADKDLLKEIGITKPVLLKLVKQIKNVSINVKTK